MSFQITKWTWLLLWLSVLGPFGSYALRERAVANVWQVRVFENTMFRGRPRLTHAAHPRYPDAIAHRLGLASNRFALIFESCLRLPAEMEVGFMLRSDDASRLSVNGERVIDNWGRHGPWNKGAFVTLEAGVHELQIDYYQDSGLAHLDFAVSLDGALPRRLGPDELSAPPCGQ